MSDTTGRRPFDLPSGCGSVSVPDIDVPTLCSLPSLTVPDVSPKPMAFNIPELPAVPIEPACIDIVPSIVGGFSPIDESAATGPDGSFRTASGYSNCLEGRYNLRFGLKLPCPINALPSKVSASGAWGDGSRPKAELRFNRPDVTACSLRDVSLHLEVPCPVSLPSVQVVSPLLDGPLGSMVFKKAPTGCRISSVSLHLNIGAGCAGASVAPSAMVTAEGRGGERSRPSMVLSVVRGSGVSGENPDACRFSVRLNLMLPWLGCAIPSTITAFPTIVTAFTHPSVTQAIRIHRKASNSCDFSSVSLFLQLPAGCAMAKYSVEPTVRRMSEPGPKVSGRVSSPSGNCNFNVSLALELGTAALVPCPRISMVASMHEDQGTRTEPSIYGRFSHPDEMGSNCDLNFSFVLDLPKLMFDANIDINLGDVEVDVQNGVDSEGVGVSNVRSFTLSLNLPKLICQPREILTVSRVQMRFFLENGVDQWKRARMWRHVSMLSLPCVKKRVPKKDDNGKIVKDRKGQVQYTETCATQCSREMNVSMKLPWWLWRARTSDTRNVRRIPILPLKRRRLRNVVHGLATPVLQDDDTEGLSMVISIADTDSASGVGDISGGLYLPCPLDNMTVVADGVNLSVVSLGGCSVRYHFHFSGYSGTMTVAWGVTMMESGLYEKRRAYVYRRGHLIGYNNMTARKVFGLAKCASG